MGDTVAIIADAHLGGPGGAAAPFLADLERVVADGASHLILLGDIFQVWIGARRFETPEVAAVAPVLRQLRRDGLRIDYVEGNRDFYIAGSPYADCFDRVALEIPFDAGGRRCLAVHGDGLNDRDWRYRFWRGLSKSLPVRLLVTRLPRRIAHRAVHRTEQGLSRTNFKHKRQIPEDAIRRYGAHRLAEGFDHLYLGHFHEPHVFAAPNGTIELLDAWFNHRYVAWPGRGGGGAQPGAA
ncbi:MAG: hypothetical protein AAF772_01250 [Acidobacteriota bacterium]